MKGGRFSLGRGKRSQGERTFLILGLAWIKRNPASLFY